MSATAYVGRLAVTLLVFVVLIPGTVVGLLYAVEHAPGGRDAALGFGYAAFFIGIPLWILGFGIALWRTARARIATVGLPGWVAFLLLVLFVADWRFFLWMFQPFFAPFLGAAIVLLVALIFLPDRTLPVGGARLTSGFGVRLATCALGIEAVLASASLLASLGSVFTSSAPLYSLDAYARRFAVWWVFGLAAAMVWSIVEGRRGMRAA